MRRRPSGLETGEGACQVCLAICAFLAVVVVNLKTCCWQCQAADAKLLGADPRLLQGGKHPGLEGQQVSHSRAHQRLRCLLEITAAAPESYPSQCPVPERITICITLLV